MVIVTSVIDHQIGRDKRGDNKHATDASNRTSAEGERLTCDEEQARRELLEEHNALPLEMAGQQDEHSAGSDAISTPRRNGVQDRCGGGGGKGTKSRSETRAMKAGTGIQPQFSRKRRSRRKSVGLGERSGCAPELGRLVDVLVA
jgi:hypothetical protein